MSNFDQFYRSLTKQFSEQQKLAVWQKAVVIPGYSAGSIRKDACGAWIKWVDYGNTDSQYGWEIDHIYPESLEGSDNISNLQPLQWQNNRAKGDSTVLVCPVKAVAG